MRIYIKKSFVLCVLILSLTACKSEEKTQAQAKPIHQVSTVKLEARPVTVMTELSGRTISSKHAEVRPQVSGIILEQVFQEGTNVKEGDLLYNIEASIYQANVDSAKANLARAEASFTAAKAKEIRTAELLKKKSISPQNYDDAKSVFLQAKADVLSAKAALSTAEINLAYTEIRAPIAGRIGKSSVTVGALVTANQPSSLTTIYQLDPMNVDLTQSVDELHELFLQVNRNQLDEMIAATSNAKISVQILLVEDTYYEEKGVLQFADVAVDEGTGTVSLRAEFANPDYFLLPGLFVRAEMEIGSIEDAILVPQRSILRDHRGNPYVYVVKESSAPQSSASSSPVYTAEHRSVKLGDTYGENWLVLEGLKAGEQVVLAGLQKVSDNASVVVLKEEKETVTKQSTPALAENMAKEI